MKTKELKNILRDLDSYDFGELFDVASDLISEVAKQNADIAALHADVDRLRAENARLREALESITELPPHGYGIEMCALMQRIAADVLRTT